MKYAEYGSLKNYIKNAKEIKEDDIRTIME
jgi:hypothetical protein